MVVIQIDGMNKDVDDGSALIHIVGGHLADIVQKGQNLCLRQRDLLVFLDSELLYLQEFRSMEHSKLELIEYLDYYNNRRIKAKLKGLPPAIHRQQALSAA